jgi:3-methylfumaryl-CoA hydratase
VSDAGSDAGSDAAREAVATGAGEDPRAWVGRERVEAGRLDLFPARGMAALLDRDPEALAEGDPLPPGWHWLYLNPATPRSRLGPDGHARRGGFLPPVALPRRMWAGGRLRFPRPLLLGERVERRSRILSVEEKQGSTGSLVRVTVAHEVRGEGGGAVEEEQDLIYREAARAGEPAPATTPLPEGVEWRETFLPDAVVLFRFSALTFNGHRIHYDHPYATGVEGYPGLVVHGPLVALLLLDAAARHAGRRPAALRYRAVGPLFGDEPITLAGRAAAGGGAAEAWAAGPAGAVATRAEVEWAG